MEAKQKSMTPAVVGKRSAIQMQQQTIRFQFDMRSDPEWKIALESKSNLSLSGILSLFMLGWLITLTESPLRQIFGSSLVFVLAHVCVILLTV